MQPSPGNIHLKADKGKKRKENMNVNLCRLLTDYVIFL